MLAQANRKDSRAFRKAATHNPTSSPEGSHVLVRRDRGIVINMQGRIRSPAGPKSQTTVKRSPLALRRFPQTTSLPRARDTHQLPRIATTTPRRLRGGQSGSPPRMQRSASLSSSLLSLLRLLPYPSSPGRAGGWERREPPGGARGGVEGGWEDGGEGAARGGRVNSGPGRKMAAVAEV